MECLYPYTAPSRETSLCRACAQTRDAHTVNVISKYLPAIGHAHRVLTCTMEVDGSVSAVAAAYPGGEGEGHAPGAATGRGGGERETSDDGVHAGKEGGGGGEDADGDVQRNRKWWRSLSGEVMEPRGSA